MSGVLTAPVMELVRRLCGKRKAREEAPVAEKWGPHVFSRGIQLHHFLDQVEWCQVQRALAPHLCDDILGIVRGYVETVPPPLQVHHYCCGEHPGACILAIYGAFWVRVCAYRREFDRPVITCVIRPALDYQIQSYEQYTWNMLPSMDRYVRFCKFNAGIFVDEFVVSDVRDVVLVDRRKWQPHTGYVLACPGQQAALQAWYRIMEEVMHPDPHGDVKDHWPLPGLVTPLTPDTMLNW